MSRRDLSVSLVGDHLDCPRLVLLRRLLGISSTIPLDHLVKGSAIHAAIVDLARGAVDDESPYTDEVLEIAGRALEVLREHGLRIVAAEYPIVVRGEEIPAGWRSFTGFVDLLCVDEQGRYWLIDTKSVNLVYLGTLRHDRQLMIYRYLIERPHVTRDGDKWRGPEREVAGIEIFRTAQLQVLRLARDEGPAACLLTPKKREPSTATDKLRCTWDAWATSCRAHGFDPARYEDRVRPALDARAWARLVPHESSPRARETAWRHALVVGALISETNRIAAEAVRREEGRRATWRDLLPLYPARLDVRGPRKNDSGGRCRVETPLPVRCALAEHCHDVMDGVLEVDAPDGELYQIRRRRPRRTEGEEK